MRNIKKVILLALALVMCLTSAVFAAEYPYKNYPLDLYEGNVVIYDTADSCYFKGPGNKVAYPDMIGLGLYGYYCFPSGKESSTWVLSSYDKKVITAKLEKNVTSRRKYILTAKAVGTTTLTYKDKKGRIGKMYVRVFGQMSKAKISGIANKKYTGKKIAQNPVVTYNGKKLVKDKDYSLIYENNLKKGTAAVWIRGKGMYTGKVKKTFKIK